MTSSNTSAPPNSSKKLATNLSPSTPLPALINLLTSLSPLLSLSCLLSSSLRLYYLTSTPAISNLSELTSTNSTVLASAVNDYNRDTFNIVGVLIIFTLLFSTVISLLIKVAKHKLFATSAVYCAMLVASIRNLTGPEN